MANNERDRNWFIEVNEKAESYKDIQKTIEATKPLYFALILHEKDIDKGEPKPPHFHAVLKYRDAKTFSTIQSYFKGAHIERAQSITACVQYLLHLNNPEKEQYLPFEIITNDQDLTSHYLKQQVSPEKFNPLMILDYIQVDGLLDYWEFVYRFGIDQVQKYRASINQLCEIEKLAKRVNLENELKSMQERDK